MYYTTSLAQIGEADEKGALIKSKIQIEHVFIFRCNYDDYSGIH